VTNTTDTFSLNDQETRNYEYPNVTIRYQYWLKYDSRYSYKAIQVLKMQLLRYGDA